MKGAHRDEKQNADDEIARLEAQISLQQERLAEAERETLACDLCLVAGSSLVVYPAAGFPALAKRRGAKLVIVNRDPTDLDGVADLVLHSEIGPTLGAAVGVE